MAKKQKPVFNKSESLNPERFKRIVAQYNKENNIVEGDVVGTDFKKMALMGGSNNVFNDALNARMHYGSEDPDADLERLIGLENIKEQIRYMENKIKFYADEGTRPDMLSGSHMVFYGPPGTGKTTVAHIMAGIYHRYGYIRKNQILDIDGEFIKSDYSENASKRVEKIIAKSVGGVLLIDEAYLLNNSQEGYQALGVLLQAMENSRSEFIVIFAGYEREMQGLLNMNSGLRSRIKTELYFPNYNSKELCEIFLKIAENNSYKFRIEDEALEMLRKQFVIETKRTDFANARDARNALDQIIDIHANNYMQNGIGEKDLITVSDIERYVEDRKAMIKRNYYIENKILIPKM